MCVVALLSTFWYVIGGWFDGIQDSDQASWTWAVLWDSMVAFPWIPALYTGVFSTGLCLWLEVTFLTSFYFLNRLIKSCTLEQFERIYIT